MSIRIITDSTADLSEAMKGKAEIVPLTISFGEEEFIDGVNITKDEFYTKLVASEDLPKTSQATPARFEEVYKKITEEGDSAVVLTISPTLSGTYQSACIAAEDYDNIRVIDSETTAIGLGIVVDLAQRLIEEGLSLDEVADELNKQKKRTRIIALLDTLTYLEKGGRISKTAAFAGGMLHIKPVIALKDGIISVLGKARGSKKANNFLMEQVKTFGIDFDMPLMLGYSGVDDALLRRYIEDSRSVWEGKTDHLECQQVGSTVGTHAGPGAIAVAFFEMN